MKKWDKLFNEKNAEVGKGEGNSDSKEKNKINEE